MGGLSLAWLLKFHTPSQSCRRQPSDFRPRAPHFSLPVLPSPHCTHLLGAAARAPASILGGRAGVRADAGRQQLQGRAEEGHGVGGLTWLWRAQAPSQACGDTETG